MIGDVVGDPGLKVLEERLPGIIADNAVDFAVVNGENAAGGFGLTDATLDRIIAAGADVVTSGNHVWEKREFWQTLQASDRVLRPANYPGSAAGRGWLHVQKAGTSWVVVNVQGREHMTPIDCPFRRLDEIIANLDGSSDGGPPADNGPAIPTGVLPIVMVDFHAESSREKEALAYHVDGRATLLAGTHTHIQTADERLLPRGTAYITDLGMTGIHDSVIGMDIGICLDRTRKQVLYRMEPALPPPGGGDGARVSGILAEIDAESGRAVAIRRL